MIKIKTDIIAIKSNPAEAKLNQKANMRVAPTRWRARHVIEKVETADSKRIQELKAKYGSNVKDWPSNMKVVDIEIDKKPFNPFAGKLKVSS